MRVNMCIFEIHVGTICAIGRGSPLRLFIPRHSLCFLAVAGVSSCPSRCRFQIRGVGKGYEAERKRTLLMNSNFYYPINTGSLGEPRRARTFNSSIQRRTSFRLSIIKGPVTLYLTSSVNLSELPNLSI